MSYIVGAFAIAVLLVIALIVPAFRLAGGILLLSGGMVAMVFAMFFGPPIAALGVLVILVELYSRRATPPRKVA